MTIEEKRDELRKLNKKLNQRILSAERRGVSEAISSDYSSVISLASRYGTKSKAGKIRFKERVKGLTDKELTEQIKIAKQALKKTGFVGKKINKITAEIFRRAEKGGIDVSTKEKATAFIDYLKFKRLSAEEILKDWGYSSGQRVAIFMMVQESGKNLSDEIDKYLAKEKVFSRETFEKFVLGGRLYTDPTPIRL